MAEQATRDPMQSLWDESPLPWRAGDNFPDREGDVIVADANGVAVLCTGDMETCTMGDIKLADLIAAAPDLLAVCEAVLVDYQQRDDYRGDIPDRLRAAIAKARA